MSKKPVIVSARLTNEQRDFLAHVAAAFRLSTDGAVVLSRGLQALINWAMTQGDALVSGGQGNQCLQGVPAGGAA